MDYQERRTQLIEIARRMTTAGLNQGTSGNLSLRVEEGFLITPSALPYDQCKTEDIVLMDSEGHSKGSRKPSTEWRFHRDIYLQRQDAGAVLHAHSPWCTTLACLHTPIPAFHYMVAVAGGSNIRCTPYATFGTQTLSDYALEALRDRKACLLGNHGLLCLDNNLNQVLSLAIEVENLARSYGQTIQTGDPILINDREMSKVLEKFKNYYAPSDG
jgi:L-fuculose-phosphate aldolase